jgi:hypothetical protein
MEMVAPLGYITNVEIDPWEYYKSAQKSWSPAYLVSHGL